MTIQQKRSTDAEAVAALIWLAFVAQEGSIPLEDDGRAYCSFTRALELYADTRLRETETREAALREVEAEQQRLLAEIQAENDALLRGATKMVAEPVPESDTAQAAKPPDTHTHTHTHTQAGTAVPNSPGGAESPARFAGKGSGEKQRILTRLLTYRAAHGLGSYARVAAATNGALSGDDIRDMADCGRHPLAQWRILDAALDGVEENKE